MTIASWYFVGCVNDQSMKESTDINLDILNDS